MAARLPSALDLGQRATPEPRRVVNTYDGGAVARVTQAIGGAINREAHTIQDKQDKVELARAKSYWLKEQVSANSDFEQDQDYATMEERYGKRLLDAKANALGMLSNADNRALFDMDMEGDYARGLAGIKSLTYKRQVDDGRSKFRQASEDNLQSLLQAPDEGTRSSIIKAQQELVKASRSRGFLTAEEEQKEGSDFVQNYAIQRAQTELQANPKRALEMLKPQGASRNVGELSLTTASKYKGVSPSYLTTTAAIETGGTFNPQSFNKNSKAAGMYQIIPSTARSLGVRDPHNPEESADATARLAVQNAQALKPALGRKPTDAELYLAHQQGAGGAKALLANPDENVVDALAKAYDGDKAKARAAVVQNGGSTSSTAKEFADQWINKYNDFEERYRGLNAKDVTPGVKTDGVQVAALDGGVVGEVVPQATPDTAGTIPYFKKTGTWVDYLPYDKRATLINNAETQVRQERAINKQLLDARVKDANSMAMQGFEDTNPPSYADFENAYEGPEAELRYREYAQAQKVAGTIHQAATMTPSQQTATLLALKPKPGPGFAEDQSNYEALQKAISTGNTERKADPIAFAQKYGMDPSAGPLDIADPAKLPQQLAERGNLGVTMNRQYGTPLRVFTEPEAQQVSTALNSMTANKRLNWLTSVSQGLSDNPTAYTAAMGQLRPGSPVTAYAGTYLGLQGKVTDEKNNPVTPQSVASGIMQGEDLINPPKDSEGKETKPAIKIPSADAGGMLSGSMRGDFNDTWGAAFQGMPQSANDAFEASRSYYAYLSAQAGAYDGQYDSDRFQQAMKAVMGGDRAVEIGDGSVVAPWGMPEDKFLDAAKVAFNRAVTDQKLRSDTWNFDDATFQGTGRPGEYTVMVGTTNMVDKNGFPVVVKVSADDAEIDPALGVPLSVLEDNRRRYGDQPYKGTK